MTKADTKMTATMTKGERSGVIGESDRMDGNKKYAVVKLWKMW